MMHSLAPCECVYSHRNWKWEPESIDTMRFVSTQKKKYYCWTWVHIVNTSKQKHCATITEGQKERQMTWLIERSARAIESELVIEPFTNMNLYRALRFSIAAPTTVAAAAAVPIDVRTISM